MRESAPAELVQMLSTLGLATADQVYSVRGQVRRLARDLPWFDSVWLDALVQGRIITRFQAAEISAGRGSTLQLGPFVVSHPVGRPGYGRTYRARDVITGEEVRLTVVRVDPACRGEMLSQLEAHIRRSTEIIAPIHRPGIVSHNRCGTGGDYIWAASPWIEGQAAAPWMAYHGRFAPEAVLEIARQILSGLLAWELAGLLHGDLGASQLLIDEGGTVRVTGGGLRCIVRPDETIDEVDDREIPADAFDYLAPERYLPTSRTTIASELFAFGCLQWHLLTGRNPLPGATRAAKVQAAQRGKIPDVRSLAPDTPEPLAALIAACTRLNPIERPQSFADIAAELGPSTRKGRYLLAQCIKRTGRAPARLIDTAPNSRRSPDKTLWTAAIAGSLLVLAVATWPQWGPKLPFDDLAKAVTGPKLQNKTVSKVDASKSANSQPDWARSANHKSITQPNSANPTQPSGPNANPIQRASFNQPIAAPKEPAETPLGNGTVHASKINLRPGQIVRGGADGRRTRVVVPKGGWPIRVENLRFENIDFVPESGVTHKDEASHTLILLQALQADFRGCSFASLEDQSSSHVAIVWSLPPGSTNNDEQLPPIGKLRFTDCIFQDLSAGIDHRLASSAAIEWTNSLHLGPGPLVQLHRWPLADEMFVLNLHHVTLRGAQGLIDLMTNDETTESPNVGRVTVRGEGCAFAPSTGGGLILFTGAKPSPLRLRSIEWSGQGSVLARDSALLVWKNGPHGETLPEDGIQVAGLVRSQIEFAGVPRGGAAANQAVRWLVPLQSPDPPGIGELRFGNAPAGVMRGRM